jgi:hypothetical protein
MDAIYRENTSVKVTVPFTDDTGSSFTPDSATYAVYDHLDNEIVAETSVSLGSDSVEITVDGANNMISDGYQRGFRNIQVKFVTGGDEIYVRQEYLIKKNNELSIMVNSFQTYAIAAMSAQDLASLDAWQHKSRDERCQAMIEAFHRLMTMTFSPWKHNDIYKETVADDAPWSRRSNVIKLTDYTQAEFERLNPNFLEALRRAQIVEADVILEGDIVGDKRRAGLLSETIGESSAMFRPGKPLDMGVSAQALRQLKGYISYSVRIGR